MTKTLEEGAEWAKEILDNMAITGELSYETIDDLLDCIEKQQARIRELEIKNTILEQKAQLDHLREATKMVWQPIETASKEHQIELLGYDADIGVYNMHWRHEIDSYCYTWNQDVCNPSHWMLLPKPPKNEE